jgi:hypothetical protein
VVIPVAILGALSEIRDDVISPEDPELYRLVHWLPDWRWQTYLLIIAILVIFFVLESAYRAISRRDNELSALKESKEPERIPLVELREMAAKVGWNIDVHTSGDAIDLESRLNQAAVDGLINFYGRKYEIDFREEYKVVSLVNIPISHFVDEYLLNGIQIFDETVKNYDIFTGKIAKTKQEQKGEIFRDIHADKRQLEDWITKNRNW